MNVLIIEASLSGHHSIYLEKATIAFLEKGDNVTIALPQNIKNSEPIRLALSKEKSVKWVEYKSDIDSNKNGFFGLIEREVTARKEFGRILKQLSKIVKIDYVFLPYFDYCLYSFGLFGSPFKSTEFGGICMRPSFHYKKCDVIAPYSKTERLKKMVFNRLLKNNHLKVLFSIDEPLVDFFKKSTNLNSKNIRYLPDPADDEIEVNNKIVRQEFNCPENSKSILVYGSIDQRKGLYLLLDTLEVENKLEDWQVWLIGRQSTEVEKQLASDRWKNLKTNYRIKERNLFVSMEMEHEVFSSCDAVWIAYDDHYGMSGVIVRAGLYSKPVIGCKHGLIGWYIKTKNNGLILKEKSISETSILLGILSSKLNGDRLGKAGKVAFMNNTWSNFSKLLQQ